MSNSNYSGRSKKEFSDTFFYKWSCIICLVLASIFLLVGVSQTAKGPSQTENLKADFSNLSKDKAVNTTLEQASDLGVEYVARSGRRSTTTYNYFLIKTQGKKLILETRDKGSVKTGAKIDIENDIAGITAQNQENLKTLSQKNIADENLKPTGEELAEIKIVSHRTGSDKFAADYWGWIASLIFIVIAIVLGIKYKWNKWYHGTDTQHTNKSFAPQTTPNTQNNFSNLEQSAPSTQLSTANPAPVSVISSTNNNLESTKPRLDQQTMYQPVYNSTTEKPKTNKTTYIILAIFLGIFGVHHFYSQKIIFGILHLVWLICFVIPLFAMEQLAFVFLFSFVLLPITFVVSLVQALVKATSKE